MFIFIDDNRPNPHPEKYNSFKSVEEAIELMSLITPSFVSTDYDLGRDKMDGLDLLRWIHNNKKYPKHINIHSDHPTGVNEMMAFIKENFPADIEITKNKV